MASANDTCDLIVNKTFEYIKIQNQNKIIKPYSVLHTIDTFKIEDEFAYVERDQRIDDFLFLPNIDTASIDFEPPKYDDCMVS